APGPRGGLVFSFKFTPHECKKHFMIYSNMIAVKYRLERKVVLALQALCLSIGVQAKEAPALSDQLVTIECTINGASAKSDGFIAELDGQPYVITSQSRLLGAERIQIKTRSGRKILPRGIEFANARNVARLPLAEGGGLALATDFAMGDPIAVVEHCNGGPGRKQGKINGVGADRVEVTATFEERHGGCPLLDRNGNVVGVASHAKESNPHAMKKGTRFENTTRYFCYRLDGAEWRKIDWKRYNQMFGAALLDGQRHVDDAIATLNRWSDSTEAQIKAALDDPHADRCRDHARKIRLIAEQRGATDFLLNELDMQAATLEAAAKIFDRYAATFY
ncbi:hypothetical protein, partial [Pontiella sp.]|uniref:hypothetical protein n=1 Tax=Pontiella sp. TaxID=2837462 RepID=UPI003569DE9C